MSSKNGKAPPGPLQLLLVASVFVLPLAIASWLYYGGPSLQPEGRTNHGAILEPIVNLREALPESVGAALSQDHWLLLYRHDGECGTACRDSLHRLRQVRLMLGRDMDRVRRVFLHGDPAPDRVFLGEQHQGLTAIEDPELGRLLAERRPRPQPAGGFFLVDPLGNLVMYFSPAIAPGDIVDDVKHLLKLSQIG